MDNYSPRMVYVFRPNEEMTIEPEYFLHDKKPPIGTIIYDPCEDMHKWIVTTTKGISFVPERMVPAHCRATALILPVPS